MGADESKGYWDSDVAVLHEEQSAARHVSHPNAATPWTLLHECTLGKWKDGHADAAGFNETLLLCDGTIHKDCSPSFCINRQGVINVNKSSSIFSFRKRSKFTKMVEHFEYNHIPAQLSSIQNFHVKSVLCHNGNLVVLHLVRHVTQFGLIDLKANKFLGIFGKQKMEIMNESLRGQISPDRQNCLIKIPSISSSGMSVEIQLQFYDLKTRNLIQQVQVPNHDCHFTFDPRFDTSRIAVTNFAKNALNHLSIVRTDTWERLATNSRVLDTTSLLYPYLHELMYSPDGSLIIAVTMDPTCHCRERKRSNHNAINISIYIFDADTTNTLHCIKYQRYTCGIHACPVNYLPLFSTCGSRLAITVNKPGIAVQPFVQVYKLPQAMNLQNMCRVILLQKYVEKERLSLFLPQKLINYLHFQPEFN